MHEQLDKIFEDIEQRIDDADEVQTANDIGDECDRLAKQVKSIRGAAQATHESFDDESVNDFYSELDMMLEHYEATADLKSKRAFAVAEEIQQENDDAEKYGTMEEQARADYYANQI